MIASDSNSGDDGDSNSHPEGVEPLGCMFACSGGGYADIRPAGLGHLAILDDEVLLNILGNLEAVQLSILTTVSKAMMCYANHEPLWKALTIKAEVDFKFSRCWRQTYMRSCMTGQEEFQAARQIRASGMYSDLLYSSWHFAHADLEPQWLEGDTIPRVAAKDLSKERFLEEYEKPNRPVIITGLASGWLASDKWSDEFLSQAFKGRTLNAGGSLLSYPNWVAYSHDSRDDLPLYLFDKQCLGWKHCLGGHLSNDYIVPEYFSEDLFQCLGADRPDWRWLISGPAKSGSSFHKDPNSTSAWNACIRGSKKWVLWPPHARGPPPGVHPSADGLNVTSPYTIQEWFHGFHEFLAAEPSAMEGICGSGDLLFVPRGWWHLAVNLEETLAVTQNFVSACNLSHVLRHLENPDLVSGCSPAERKTLRARFEKAMQKAYPELLGEFIAAEDERTRAIAGQQALSCLFGNAPGKPLKRKLEASDVEEQKSGFSFGFSFGEAVD